MGTDAVGQQPPTATPADGGSPPVDTATKAKLEAVGIEQREDGNFYENGKLLTNPKTGQPMNEEEVKAHANEKKPGSFPEAQKQPSDGGNKNAARVDNESPTPPAV